MLAKSIIYQQLSGKAAGTIWNRFLTLVGSPDVIHPAIVTILSVERLRSVGLSSQKASYLLDLAEKTTSGAIRFDSFRHLNDEAIRESLCSVRGIGSWTADMFLMFALRRPDVFPTGDLGIRNAMIRMFELSSVPSPSQMETFAEGWRPHRTVAACYLWRILDGDSWEWGGK